MRVVTIQRSYMSSDVTLGILKIKDVDHPPIYTLENPWLSNKPYISCIPEDSYLCTKFNGMKYKDVWEVQGVTNRSSILIHHGNTEDNTQGCILVGLSAGELNGQPAVLQSRDAMDLLRSLIGSKDFALNIFNPRANH